jgi:hypothetical protein
MKNVHPTFGEILAAFSTRIDMHRAMGERKNPKHPMFRNHNCAYCFSGEKPCKQGNPSQCDNPRARND